MFNRIEQKFRLLRAQKKKALIVYITAGDPQLALTEKLIYAFEKSGVDVIELGVPFSDPLADGPTIQAASQRALKQGVNLDRILSLVHRIRRHSQIPIALMSYYNPIFHYGETRLVKNARASGVDGLSIPDLPPEEGSVLIKSCRKNNIATIFFLSPTTHPQRMKKIVASSTGFIYFVSLTGVTGARQQLSHVVAEKVRKAKQSTPKPICVGFGISSADQVRTVARWADGVIIGSAIINEMSKLKGDPRLVPKVSQYVKHLSRALS